MGCLCVVIRTMFGVVYLMFAWGFHFDGFVCVFFGVLLNDWLLIVGFWFVRITLLLFVWLFAYGAVCGVCWVGFLLVVC